jgi:hypothetical protein
MSANLSKTSIAIRRPLLQGFVRQESVVQRWHAGDVIAGVYIGHFTGNT